MAHAAEVISQWHQSIEGVSTSSQDFYASIEKALRELLRVPWTMSYATATAPARSYATGLRLARVEWRRIGL